MNHQGSESSGGRSLEDLFTNWLLNRHTSRKRALKRRGYVVMPAEFGKVPTVKVLLDNGATVYIEDEGAGGEEKVSIITESTFKDVTDAIEGVADALISTFKKVKPSGATVEFGIEVGVEAGKLTALLVKGSANATLKITITWGNTEAIAAASGQ